jgi:TonB-dependent SusC/RagA subfamily outer membrane receptor
VLKGPEAAALYGIDAANGAIIITTKRGKPGEGRVITATASVLSIRVVYLLSKAPLAWVATVPPLLLHLVVVTMNTLALLMHRVRSYMIT